MRPGGHFYSLDGLRGIAAVAVLLSHIELMRARNLPATTQMFPGQMAVDIFFALSGFVMAFTYLGRAVDWRTFLRARLARIYPLHIATALIILAMNIAGARLTGDSDPRLMNPQGAVEQLFLVSALPGFSGFVWNMPSWSISIEWWLYLTLFPCLAVLTRRTPLILGAVAMLALCTVFALYLNAHFLEGGTTRGWIAVGRGICGFTLGWLVWRIWRETTFAPPAWVTDLAAALIMLVWYGSNHVGLGQGWYALPLIPVLILGLSRGSGRVVSLLCTRTLVWLGKVSYSIYLTHMIVLMPLQVVLRKLHLAQNFAVWVVIAVPATLCLSAVSYRWFEAPVRDMIRAVPVRRARATARRA
jgi:peptidoglycan/LPS O-acetylase OafA/YrhL